PAATATDIADEPWGRTREKDMKAVLYVPSRYKEDHRQGDATDQPRMVIYDGGEVQLRLSEWDAAPATPTGRAKQQADEWARIGAADTQFTETSLQGRPAVVADTTYDAEEGRPTRVMQLVVTTDDGRMYELRVDMPKGTPDEKEGTSVFKAARDRLEIEKAAS
ncbi:MAG: serine/threonine protein kinase, partial [Streptomyces sp.]|nr:serine/threonine protein kinase [Streptomyces sp.]NUS31237.1 serine/threonine protein kinase [Streptomyces sp.]